MEKAHIVAILKETDWNVKKSADILQIDRSTLYSKIKRYEIRKPD
ncbi:MAG: helix-turn-helix domain-containing protein [Deltaproteobacteria bacterium]